MNILLVTPYFVERGKSSSDGFMVYLYRISRALRTLGHRPIILAAGKRDIQWVEDGVEIISVRDRCLDTSDKKGFDWLVDTAKKSYWLNRKIRELKKKVTIDIIQFASTRAPAFLYYGDIPAVMRVSLYSRKYFQEDELSGKDASIRAWCERMSSRRCNAVFAPSRMIAESFGKDIRRKVFVIETPFVEESVVYDMYYADGLLAGKKYALFFGALVERKGIGVIAKCLERFLKRNPEHYFVFAGKVPNAVGANVMAMLEQCAGSCAERVINLPALPHAQLYPVIQKADFIVLPSLMDNLPNACIEAMHFGKVVIGTEGASFEQLIRHGVSGLLCRIGDAEDLLEKMQTAVELDEGQKEKIGRSAKKRIDRLRPEIAAKRLVEFYRSVL